MLDMMALGVTVPILPGLIRRLLHGDAALAARYVGWFAALWATMQFIFQPVLGGLSDRFGRRPVMLASMFGMAADYVVMAWAPTVGWLLIGRAISGLTASSFAVANAYIADITPPEQRASRFGVLSAAFGIGFIAGPVIGGLLGQIDPRLPFWGAAALCFCNGVYGLFVVPESLKPENRSPFQVRAANPLGAFELYRSKPGLLALAAVMFIFYLAHQVLQSTWVPYAAYRYNWPNAMMGVSLMVVGIGSVVVQMFLVRRVVARVGGRGALCLGLLFGAIGFTLYGLAPTGWWFLSAIPVYSLMGLVGPGVQSLMSRRISANEQGRLQGANGSLMAIANMTGPILFTEIFARSIGPWSAFAPVGLPFFVAAALLTTSLGLALGTRRAGEEVDPVASPTAS
jgi:DHA1 family tetracycline resistance protein-like MFS transporter